MTKQETCGQSHCYLPKGHKGLHKVRAQVYDVVEPLIGTPWIDDMAEFVDSAAEIDPCPLELTK